MMPLGVTGEKPKEINKNEPFCRCHLQTPLTQAQLHPNKNQEDTYRKSQTKRTQKCSQNFFEFFFLEFDLFPLLI